MVFVVFAAQHGTQHGLEAVQGNIGDETQPPLVDAHHRHIEARQLPAYAQHGAVPAHHQGQVALTANGGHIQGLTDALRTYFQALQDRPDIRVVVLQGAVQAINQPGEPAVLAVCVAYLVATVALRVLARQGPPSPGAGPQWLPSIGLDLAASTAMQLLHAGTMNYTPLFGLPILMASVLGTLTLALGTTAAVTLLLLLWAWWTGDQSSSDDAQRYLQSALTGTGYFVVSYLVHQLSARLVGEQEVAHCSQSGLSISALMMENEKCFNTPEEIYKKLGKIWTTMREGIERGCRTEGILQGMRHRP